MGDKLVLDLETKKSFEEVGGDQIRISWKFPFAGFILMAKTNTGPLGKRNLRSWASGLKTLH